MANTIRLEIITPDAVVYSSDVEMVTLSSVEGQIGILPRHTRLITQLTPGEIIVHKNGRQDFLAVGVGIVEVSGDEVSIVTDMAIPSDKIDEANAEQVRQQAEARLHERSLLAKSLLSTPPWLARWRS